MDAKILNIARYPQPSSKIGIIEWGIYLASFTFRLEVFWMGLADPKTKDVYLTGVLSET